MKGNVSSLATLAVILRSIAATCLAPEPITRICYNEADATPQNVKLKDIQGAADYLRTYGSGKLKPRWTMKVKDADNCGEWQVTKKGSVLVLAKLVGDQDASITFDDLAATLDGGAKASSEARFASLMACGTAGGQMGVMINSTDPYYTSKAFTTSEFVNTGIVVKLVHVV